MEIIQRLPEDVRRYIIPFTYNPQPKDLLADIVNYQYTLNNVIGAYKVEWTNEEVYDWLINDIFAWLNNNVPTMYGYVPSFYDVWSRFPPFQPYMPSQSVMNLYLRFLEKKSSMTQIRVFWGLLTPFERNRFSLNPDFPTHWNRMNV
tara:strand:- start:869 stop:1309 length:441 start_codon:yes stop_codon:yes gene_type:complete